MDSDHRSRKATDLQSAPFDRSGTPPYRELRRRRSSLSAALRRWSWQTDLNPRPADYKSAALPTELRQHGNGFFTAPDYDTILSGGCQDFSAKAPLKRRGCFVVGGLRPADGRPAAAAPAVSVRARPGRGRRYAKTDFRAFQIFTKMFRIRASGET